MELTDEQTKALREFESATKNMRAGLVGKPGFSAERVYGIAYQALVRVGLAPQIKNRYRP